MQNEPTELLTTEEMRAIDQMPAAKALALMHYCANERLALCTADEYAAIMGANAEPFTNRPKMATKQRLSYVGISI